MSVACAVVMPTFAVFAETDVLFVTLVSVKYKLFVPSLISSVSKTTVPVAPLTLVTSPPVATTSSHA